MCGSCEPTLCRLSTCDWGLGRLKKRYPNPANASLAQESKQINLGYSELQAQALHGAGGVRLPTLEPTVHKKRDKVSCRASGGEGRTFKSRLLGSSYQMQFGSNWNALVARRYLLLSDKEQRNDSKTLLLVGIA